MVSHQEPSAPDVQERQAAIAFTSTATTTPSTATTTSPARAGAGIDWNGPAAFWIALPLVVAIVTAIGLLLQ